MPGIQIKTSRALLMRLLTELLGGAEVVEMLTAYHAAAPGDRASYRDLAARHKMPIATVHAYLARARIKLRRVGLMPPEWEQQTPERSHIPAEPRRTPPASIS